MVTGNPVPIIGGAVSAVCVGGNNACCSNSMPQQTATCAVSTASCHRNLHQLTKVEILIPLQQLQRKQLALLQCCLSISWSRVLAGVFADSRYGMGKD
jgi:hypothetical protein